MRGIDPGAMAALTFDPFARVSVFRLTDEWLAKHVGAAARRVGAHRVGAMALAEVAATACRQGRFKVAAMVAGVAGGAAAVLGMADGGAIAAWHFLMHDWHSCQTGRRQD